jgi:hypothetical protein
MGTYVGHFASVRDAVDSAFHDGAVVHYAPNYDIYVRVDHLPLRVSHLIHRPNHYQDGVLIECHWTWQQMMDVAPHLPSFRELMG